MQIGDLLELSKVSGLGSYHLKHDDTVMVILLNAALKQVYMRVPALTKEYVLVLHNGKTFYSYPEEAYRIIQATTVCGKKITVNSNVEYLAIFDTGNHRLDVPIHVHEVTDAISMLLHIKPPTVTCANIGTLDFLIDDALVSSIISYMSYTAGKNISESNGVGHYQEFLQQIDEVKKLGLYNTYSHSTNTNIKSNGWV